jgi:DNA-binding NarL/FixJ family response regulator
VARYASVRAGLASMLEDASDLKIVGEVTGGGDFDETFASDPADVILCDAEADEARDVIKCASEHDAAIVLLDNTVDVAQTLSTATLRGWALLPKDAERDEIRAALRAVVNGLVTLDRSIALSLLRPTIASAGATAIVEVDVLTAREKEILTLMAEGLPNKQIAIRLSISLHTVKFHVASILAKLGVQSRTEAVTLGIRQGLVIL